MFLATTYTAKGGTSIIGTVLHPIFVLIGYILAFFYGVVPNYAVAIALLTIVVMVVVFPLTRASARSMMRMQLLSPEMKRIQTRYKPKPGMTAAERQELRQKMNEEMMALYRENGVNPTGGCLPMFLQFPILIVLYDVVRGLSKTAELRSPSRETHPQRPAAAVHTPTPQNIPKTSRMYHDLVAAKGQMHALWDQPRRLGAHPSAAPGRRHPLRAAGAHRRRTAVRLDLAGHDTQPSSGASQPADAADAEVHAPHIPGALHRPARWRRCLFHRLQLVPGRAAGVDVQT